METKPQRKLSMTVWAVIRLASPLAEVHQFKGDASDMGHQFQMFKPLYLSSSETSAQGVADRLNERILRDAAEIGMRRQYASA
jgi:hypothetical protein